MPCMPAASSAAKARYGLATAPGMRHSTRSALPWPTTRKPQVRLSYPQARVVGAQLPAAYRLYELMFGARNTANSPAHATSPARYSLKSGDSPANSAFPSPQRLEWLWDELAIQV